MIHGITTAYRADISSRGNAFGPRDDEWLAIASLISQAHLVPDQDRQILLDHAVDFAERLLGADVVRRAADFEWGQPGDVDRMRSESILILAEEIYQLGALHLARAVIDALLEVDSSLDVVHRGRILAKRARSDWRLGRMEEAADQYRMVARLGREARSAELRIRAWIGYSTLAQQRGNYPQQRRYARRAAALADRLGLRNLSRLGHLGLMVSAGIQHRYEEAFQHAQIAYQHSLGNAIREGEILQNLGQLLVEMGDLGEAERLFAAVLSRPLPVRIILPALGGLAATAASRGDAARVAWVSAELKQLRQVTFIPRIELALAFLEAAPALALVGQSDSAERALEEAVRIAESAGYHEIIIKAEAYRRARQESLDAATRRSARTGANLTSRFPMDAADELPEHVAITASSV